MSYADLEPSHLTIAMLDLAPEDAETEEAHKDRESTCDEVTADDLADAAEDDEATSYRLADLPEPVRREVQADPVWLALDRLVKGAMMTTRRLGSLTPA